jgi:hypothetical protein
MSLSSGGKDRGDSQQESRARKKKIPNLGMYLERKASEAELAKDVRAESLYLSGCT